MFDYKLLILPLLFLKTVGISVPTEFPMQDAFEKSLLRDGWYIQNCSTLGAGYSPTSSQGQGSRSHEENSRSREEILAF